MTRSLFCILLCAVLFIGCGDDDPADTDTTMDTTTDMTGDTGGDTPSDTGDVAGDTPDDTATDTGGDIPSDMGNDTTMDTAMDTADMGGSVISQQFDALNDAIEASGVAFCVCAGDSNSNFCSVDAGSCFADPGTCQAQADGFQAVPVAERACYVAALELDAASGAAVTCLTTAYTAFTACLTTAACDHTAMLACGNTWQAALQGAPCTLPDAVENAVGACMAP